MKSERGDIETILPLLSIFALLTIFFGVIFYTHNIKYGNIQTLEITIKDKYIKGTNGKSSSQKYLIVDTENNTYEITDLFWNGKFDSTDLYNQLDIGNTYKITTSGIRNHFWSMYPNINELERIEK